MKKRQRDKMHEPRECMHYLHDLPIDKTVGEVYDGDYKAQEAFIALCPNFEYPNWAHLTIKEFLDSVRDLSMNWVVLWLEDDKWTISHPSPGTEEAAIKLRDDYRENDFRAIAITTERLAYYVPHTLWKTTSAIG